MVLSEYCGKVNPKKIHFVWFTIVSWYFSNESVIRNRPSKFQSF